jgi:hypothetical protein
MRNYDEVCARILVLSEQVWEHKVKKVDIDDWLDNFDGSSGIPEDEKEHALHLLAHFNHFGDVEIRQLLRALYRDHFRYPLLQKIRNENGGSNDPDVIEPAFRRELAVTRFLGMGGPSESGNHLLYPFRQENQLQNGSFTQPSQLLTAPDKDGKVRLGVPGLRRIVFVDDVLGSGEQAGRYTTQLLARVHAAAAESGVTLEVLYLVLFARPDGLARLRRPASPFTEVRAVHELDSSEFAFSANSRVYVNAPPTLTKEFGKQMSQAYGEELFPAGPLGFGDGQLLLGMHHNVPDNTLPIFWAEHGTLEWTPVFKRYVKGP